MKKWRLEGFIVMNMEDLGYWGRLQAFPNGSKFKNKNYTKCLFIGKIRVAARLGALNRMGCARWRDMRSIARNCYEIPRCNRLAMVAGPTCTSQADKACARSQPMRSITGAFDRWVWCSSAGALDLWLCWALTQSARSHLVRSSTLLGSWLLLWPFPPF